MEPVGGILKICQFLGVVAPAVALSKVVALALLLGLTGAVGGYYGLPRMGSSSFPQIPQ
jgi:hypothetical protein